MTCVMWKCFKRDQKLEGTGKGQHSFSFLKTFFLDVFSRETTSYPQDVVAPDDENELLRDLDPLLLRYGLISKW